MNRLLLAAALSVALAAPAWAQDACPVGYTCTPDPLAFSQQPSYTQEQASQQEELDRLRNQERYDAIMGNDPGQVTVYGPNGSWATGQYDGNSSVELGQ